jgi:ABC-type bacteriocin/lantibiotic exporter with double-glycine peptidase domain
MNKSNLNIFENINWNKLKMAVCGPIMTACLQVQHPLVNMFDETDFDEKRFYNAIRLSKLENLIKNLPNGIDTFVGEKGKLLSGGEIQRLGIARALYLNPDVLIFDESTNALDEDLEREIMDDIKQLKRIKTIIIISHNFKKIDFFDKIIKLE